MNKETFEITSGLKTMFVGLKQYIYIFYDQIKVVYTDVKSFTLIFINILTYVLLRYCWKFV